MYGDHNIFFLLFFQEEIKINKVTIFVNPYAEPDEEEEEEKSKENKAEDEDNVSFRDLCHANYHSLSFFPPFYSNSNYTCRIS